AGSGLTQLRVTADLVREPQRVLDRLRVEGHKLEAQMLETGASQFAEKFSNEHGLAVVFDETAVRRLVERAQTERMTMSDLCAHLFKDYQFGLSLIKKNTGRTQYVFVLLISLVVAWLSLSILPRWRSRLLVGLLLVELFALSWVCSLYRIFFQPIPSVLALVFAFAVAEGWSAFLRRDHSHLVRTFFADRLSRKEFRRISDGTDPFDPRPKPYEVSVVVCDIA